MEKKSWEKIIEKSGKKVYEWRTCKWTREEFPVFEEEKEILEKVSYHFPISVSELSPDSRIRALLMWRNERNFYKRKCSATGKDIMSIFPTNYPSPVYHFKEYDSDRWNPHEYGIEYNDDKSLLIQIERFFNTVPKRNLNLTGETMENCDYCNYGFYSKNCYMCQVALMSEQCFYSNSPYESKYNFDCYFNEKCEISYESTYCINSYKTFYCDFVENSNECYFCTNLNNSEYCIWCVWISDRKYCVFNKQVSEAEFYNTLEKIFYSYESLESFKREYQKFKEDFSKLSVKNIGAEHAIWNTIRFAKNITSSYGVIDAEDVFHSWIIGLNSNNILSSTHGWSNSSNIYQNVWFSESIQSAFNSFWTGKNCFYTYDCRHCEDCLFCIWLISKKYCIFNIQYSEDEYKDISRKVIDGAKDEWFWWNFLSPYVSLFPYNDTIANDFYPVEEVRYLDQNKQVLKIEQKDKKGTGIVYVLDPTSEISEAFLDLWGEEKISITWRTKDTQSTTAQTMNSILARDMPEISDIDDSTENLVVSCEQSGKIFRIIKEELAFYKQYNIPLPRKHPEIRYKYRFESTPKNTFFLRKCIECWSSVLSVWERDKIICENCSL